jgi:cytochrome P450
MDIQNDPYSVPLESIDMSDPDLHHRGLEHVYFERLRNEAPVHYYDSATYGPFWSLSRYEDIIAIDKNHRDWSSDHKNGGHVLGYELWFNDESGLHWPMFLAMDRPKHDVQRKAVSPVVGAENLKNLESGIRQSADEILDSLPDDEPFNWVESVSVELTTRTLATLFDFPMEERHRLTRWSNYAFATPGDGLIDSWDERTAVMMEMKEVFEQLREERKHKAGGFDMISMIANPIDGADLSPEEYMGNVILLLVGGNDTTRNSLTASALGLNRFPAEDKKLRDNPELIPSFCSEAIRWHTPLPQMKRTALNDMEVGGQKVREGEKVVMWYISGNRDENIFDKPHDFIIDRPNVRNHMAFGFGLHRCVGNRLAELQLRIAWEGILKRFKSVELVNDPVRVRSNAINGYSDMQVRVKRY